VNANSGLLTFDRAGTSTLGSNATNFYSATIADGTTLDTSAASNFSFTTANVMVIGDGASGVLTCNASDISLGSGIAVADYALRVNNGAIFTGGSGTHIIGSIRMDTSSNTTLSSGVTTIDTARTGNLVAILWSTTGAGSFDDGNGTVILTQAGDQLLYDANNTARTLYNLTINKASGLIQYDNAQGFALTVDNDFTITAGEFDTSETISGTSRDLTVTGLTSVTGTLTCNASTVSFGSGVTTNYALNTVSGGTFNGGSGTHTIGSIRNQGTVTLTSGTTTIDSGQPADVAMIFVDNPNFDDNNGTITFTRAGAQLLYDNNNTARTFYNLTINKASGTVQYYNANGFNLTVNNDFTITAGEFDTSETVTGTSRDLTVQGGLHQCRYLDLERFSHNSWHRSGSNHD